VEGGEGRTHARMFAAKKRSGGEEINLIGANIETRHGAEENSARRNARVTALNSKTHQA